ncbi:MAG: ABC transporter substrate-binding protein [Desulfurococcaceae archaeon]
MIKRTYAVIIAIVVVIVAVAGAAAYFLTLPPPPTAPAYVKIGWPTPMTGKLAAFAEPNPWIKDRIEHYVNNVMGGVYLAEYGKKVPIKIILRDTKSDPSTAASVAAELITRENVDLMVVLHTPDTTVPVSTQCERYGVPCISLDTPVLAWLTGAPYKWSYHAFWTEIDLAHVYASIWDEVETNKLVAGLWSNDPDGWTFQKVFPIVLEARGYKLQDFGLFPPGTMDFSTYILSLRTSGADIVTGVFFPPDFASFWRQCYEAGYIPKVVTVARCVLFPAQVEALGVDPLGRGLGKGLTTEVWAHPVFPFRSSLTGETPRDLTRAYEEETGRQWCAPMMYSHAAFELAVDALKRAGSLDKEKVRVAIANTDLDTIVGRINYKKPLNEILSPEEYAIYEKVAEIFPQLLKYQDHYSITPLVGGQWVKGAKWPYEIQIVANWKYKDIPVTAQVKTINELLATSP